MTPEKIRDEIENEGFECRLEETPNGKHFVTIYPCDPIYGDDYVELEFDGTGDDLLEVISDSSYDGEQKAIDIIACGGMDFDEMRDVIEHEEECVESYEAMRMFTALLRHRDSQKN